jgi:hypothetical protein
MAESARGVVSFVMASLSFVGNRHPEPSGSRRTTLPLSFQHSPGQFLFRRGARLGVGAQNKKKAVGGAIFAEPEELSANLQVIHRAVSLSMTKPFVAHHCLFQKGPFNSEVQRADCWR